jgi:ribosomal protein S18 acetylase RimI-like enzyme
MEIVSFKAEYLPEMAALFAARFQRLRARVPLLPDAMENPIAVTDGLRRLFAASPGVVALEGSRVAGYLGAYLVDEFRGTERRAAYVPEWGHAAASPQVYRALYAKASALWFDAGCAAHCISLLAHDRDVENVWFWHGFGLIVVDGIRSTEPLPGMTMTDLHIRKARTDDRDALAALEAEHAQYYRQPPILMAAYEPHDQADGLSDGGHTIYLALDGETALGFMRFEAVSEGAASIVDAPDKVACTGAYVRAQTRGRGVGKALLNAALRGYAVQGFTRCSVDFESFNPEAAAFWPKYFELVRLSLFRVPERAPD